MSMADRRQRQIRWLALTVCALSLVVVAVSAYLRLEAAGLGCADWPHCYGRVLAGDPAALHYGFARLLHRVAASTALLLTILLVWRCLRPAVLQPAARYALALLALMLALSVLGFFSADPRRALVGFLNIVGGLGLVTFSWRVAMAAGALPPPSVLASGLLLRVGVVVLTVTVALGAWIGATYSALACASLPVCDFAGWGAADLMRALNPLHRPEAAAAAGDAAGTLLHLMHRGMALLALLLFGVTAWRMRTAAAWGVLASLLLTLGLGVFAVGGGFSLWAVIAHGSAAAIMLAAVASLLRR